MKKYLSSLFLSSCALLISAPALAQGTYQLKNAGFEEWEDVTYSPKASKTYSGQEPKYWNSFFTGTGQFKGTAATKNQCEKSTDVRSSSSSTYSAKIFDRYVLLKICANGNLTTGCINMGSMTASDSSGNYNFTNTSNDDFNQKFTGLPDAMNVWVKYHSTNSSYRAKATTILHTAGYYQDPLGNSSKITAKLVATATDETIQPNDTWTELTVPFTYSLTDGTRPAYALVSFSTNATPGTGTGSDYLLIDDLSYVYYHTLSALSYNGKSILTDGKTAYDLSTEAYDASKLAYTKKAVGGTVEASYDDATALLTITVKGDNYEVDNTSVTTYTVQFKKTITINTTTSLVCSAGEANVNFSRSFKQGWNTLVLPFATTADELGAKEVATLSAGNDNTAVFHVSEDGAIKANEPYVVYFEAAHQATISKVVTVAATSDVKSVTPDGSALTFTGNYTAARSLYEDGVSLGYGLVNSDGKSTIRPAGSGATLPATCAYFTVNTSGAATKAFSVVFEGSDVTGIDNTFSLTDGQLTPAIRGVYTLQGVKVSNGSTQGLPAGFYIVNGKKTIVR